eukprot:5678018-Alexandrium_andersonii.AAC.1
MLGIGARAGLSTSLRNCTVRHLGCLAFGWRGAALTLLVTGCLACSAQCRHGSRRVEDCSALEEWEEGAAGAHEGCAPGQFPARPFRCGVLPLRAGREWVVGPAAVPGQAEGREDSGVQGGHGWVDVSRMWHGALQPADAQVPRLPREAGHRWGPFSLLGGPRDAEPLGDAAGGKLDGCPGRSCGRRGVGAAGLPQAAVAPRQAA